MRLFIFRVLPEALVASLYYPALMDGLARRSLSDVNVSISIVCIDR